jgi:hypothetical protein
MYHLVTLVVDQSGHAFNVCDAYKNKFPPLGGPININSIWFVKNFKREGKEH